MLFEQALDQGLSQAKRHGWGLAVLFIDIDKFKSINDSYGHDLGDKVLLMVGKLFKVFIRAEDTVSRWGGDEFACLLLEIKHEADVTRLAEEMVNRIAETCVYKRLFFHKSQYRHGHISRRGETADILFKNADMAMFKAKGTEKRVMLFSEYRF